MLVCELNLIYIFMRVLGNVIKSKSDNRLYKAIKLKNEIECLIISDQQAKRSSAAMSVGVGSLQDPQEAQGLAHYLQHMLFMGTLKYPNENDYSNFITKNFGSSNAYTSQDQTNYHFEVSSNAFKETLDRFAQFFISPLMSDSSSQRELNAVHSEHTKNLLNDAWRKYQLSKYLAKKGHPYQKFSTGNKQSLSNPNLREMLHNFYKSNYSSNLMKLVVCGNEAPDQMSKLVQQKFSEVPNRMYKKFQMLEQPYSQQKFQKIYKVHPIQDKKILQMTWMLKNKSALYQNPPSSYLSYIIGHEGQGSLLSFLIAQGLATGISAGGHDAYNCFSQFQVRVSLTKKGVENVKQVIQYILYFIQKLKQEQPREWVFNQMRDVYRMKFEFLQKKQGMQFTSGLAKRLQQRKIQEVLEYPYFMKKWLPSNIKQYIQELNKENLMIFLQAKQVENDCNLVQPIYQTRFGIADLDGYQPRVCPIRFPPKNPFIPTNFELLKMGEQPTPQILYKSDKFEVFYKKDHCFQLPKVIIKFRFYFEGTNSIKQSLSRKIYLEMLTQKMREFVYLGDSAETFSGVDFDSYYSLDIQFNGFRDSTLKFVKPYLEQFFAFEPTDIKYFQTVKQNTERGLSNYFLGDPYRLAYNLTSMATRHGTTGSPSQKLKQIRSITFGDIVNFGRNWNRKLYIESYLTGNLETQQAKDLFAQAAEIINKKSIPLSKTLIGDVRPIKIPPNINWVVEQVLANDKEANSAVVVHYQHEATSIRSKVLQDLSYNFVKQPAFDFLRTKQQLGYIVMCLPDDNRGILGLSILVQSAIKSSYQLISYVNTFIDKILLEKLQSLSEQIFAEYKNSLRMSKMEKDKNLSMQAGRFWAQIVKHRYQFKRTQKQLQQLQTVSLQQFKNFVKLVFYLNTKRLEIHLMSHHFKEKNNELKKKRLSENANVRIFSTPEEFRKRMELYPDYYSHL